MRKLNYDELFVLEVEKYGYQLAYFLEEDGADDNKVREGYYDFYDNSYIDNRDIIDIFIVQPSNINENGL